MDYSGGETWHLPHDRYKDAAEYVHVLHGYQMSLFKPVLILDLTTGIRIFGLLVGCSKSGREAVVIVGEMTTESHKSMSEQDIFLKSLDSRNVLEATRVSRECEEMPSFTSDLCTIVVQMPKSFLRELNRANWNVQIVSQITFEAANTMMSRTKIKDSAGQQNDAPVVTTFILFIWLEVFWWNKSTTNWSARVGGNNAMGI